MALEHAAQHERPDMSWHPGMIDMKR